MKKVIYTKQNQALCEWLRSCRQKEGLTVRALAKCLKTDHSVVCRVENGERMLNFVEFIEWVVALQVNPHDAVDKVWVIEIDEQMRANPPSWKLTGAESIEAEASRSTPKTKNKGHEKFQQ